MDFPTNFTRDVIMKAPRVDIMNSMTRSILTLACYDDRQDDLSLSNVLRQCIMLISNFSMMAVYGYHAYNHYDNNGSMYIHRPDSNFVYSREFPQNVKTVTSLLPSLKRGFLTLHFYCIWSTAAVIIQLLPQELLLHQVQIHILQ